MSEFVTLGRSGLKVHPIGLGANKISDADPETNTEYGGDILLDAIDKGLNFIDTAFIYGDGKSESIIGETLKKNNLRQDIVIATKGAHEYVDGELKLNNSPEFLTKQVEDSLARLQTDYIDLYYIHFPDENTPKAEAIGALSRLKEQGKIRSIGVSNFSFDQIKEANVHQDIDVVQDEYNLLNQEAESKVFQYYKEQNISFIPYFPFASGLLAGKYDQNTQLTDRQKSRPQFQEPTYSEILGKVEQIRPLAEKYNTGLQNIVLAYYLSKDVVDAVIPGARNRKQMEQNLEAANFKLTEDECKFIANIFPPSFKLK
ncbi:aldo/keto reductase [Marinilactibacillus sp. Marseille-P9653]|uniref:aldo/keto reductase n=1 Tax=Marinilactibacillus sp. Marseille-P9653 TaxID=2866583 RepID=UPI001CE3EE79|nr:aldo/keto reductase [Marinilactibacillus sp. Marseille-P9653]